jgi:hypothetical protein
MARANTNVLIPVLSPDQNFNITYKIKAKNY